MQQFVPQTQEQASAPSLAYDLRFVGSRVGNSESPKAVVLSAQGPQSHPRMQLTNPPLQSKEPLVMLIPSSPELARAAEPPSRAWVWRGRGPTRTTPDLRSPEFRDRLPLRSQLEE